MAAATRRPAEKSLPEPCCSSCGRGGPCDCRHVDDEFCAAVSRQILDLDAAHTDLLRDYEIVEGLRRTKALLFQMGAGYSPVALDEQRARELRRQLEDVVAERQRLLRELCSMCPDNPMCHV